MGMTIDDAIPILHDMYNYLRDQMQEKQREQYYYRG